MENYLEKALNPSKIKKCIDDIVRGSEKLPKFEAIAVTGLSGLLVGPIVAIELGLPLIVVRKDLKCAHSTNRVEGYAEGLKYIIIDDFVASGNTVHNIKLYIGDYSRSCKLVGALMWSGPMQEGERACPWLIALNVPVCFCQTKTVWTPSKGAVCYDDPVADIPNRWTAW